MAKKKSKPKELIPTPPKEGKRKRHAQRCWRCRKALRFATDQKVATCSGCGALNQVLPEA